MLVSRCDNCRKIISYQDQEGLELNRGYVIHLDLCNGCAIPIINIIIERQLLNSRSIKKLQAPDPLVMAKV